jgi:hypothetical protein
LRKISKKKHHEQTRLLDAVKPIYQKEIVELNKAKFISILSAADELEDVAQLRDNIQTLIDIFFQSREDEAGILSVDPDEESIPFQRDVLISELRADYRSPDHQPVKILHREAYKGHTGQKN